MEEKVLQELVDAKLSVNQISKKVGKSPTSIRYWLKKYNIKLFRGKFGSVPNVKELPHKCKCGETDPSKFYGRKRTVCGKCHNQYTIKKGQEKRDKARKYLGDKCQICNFNKYKCSLDIHHTNPSEKDPNFASMRGWTWEKIKNELQSCILLCKNCHAAVHNNELKI